MAGETQFQRDFYTGLLAKNWMQQVITMDSRWFMDF